MRDTLAFSPPLILEKSDVDEIVEAFSIGLDLLVKELADEGIWSPSHSRSGRSSPSGAR